MPSVFCRLKSRKALLSLAVILLSVGAVFAADTAHAAPPILPDEFGGWQISAPAQTSKEATVADPVNSELLKEYGFTDFASAVYKRDDGRKLTIKAARFGDASGAYGAFTYYKEQPMLREQIGDQGASLNERVLFYRGNVLIDAVFEKLSAMSAAELRELAAALPRPTGSASGLPGLPAYLPRDAYVKNSAKYVVGPLGLSKVNAPLPEQFVDFHSGAEVVLANYDTPGGQATLMLISYPTPQIAGTSLRRLDAAKQQTTPATSGPSLPAGMGPIYDKRTGPILVVATGALSPNEAKGLLAAVNYDADVTWNENTYFTKKDNIANLLVNVIILCGIIGGLAIVAGIAFGGLRVLYQRLLPEQIREQRDEMEFISLHLAEKLQEAPHSPVSSSIKTI